MLLLVLLLSSKYSADGFGFGRTTVRWQPPQDHLRQQQGGQLADYHPRHGHGRSLPSARRRRVSSSPSSSASVILGATNASRRREQIMEDAIASVGLTQVKKKKTSTTAKKKNGTTMNKKRESTGQKQNADAKKNKRQQASTRPISSPTSSPSSSPSPLQEAADISLQTQLEYAREGHASLRNLIPPPVVHELYADLKAYSTDTKYRRKGEDSAPFLQFYNTWRDLPSVKRLVNSPRLCRAACTLMGMRVANSSCSTATSSPSSQHQLPPPPSLRLYQDSVFIKRKHKDGITPWHIDGRMMPFDTSNVITFWIPLHAIPAIDDGGTGLLFIHKSHSDFSLPYWNGRGMDDTDDDDGSGGGDNAYENLTGRYGIENVGDDRIVDNNPGVIGHHMPLSVGDCTVHNGWTMHCANGNLKNLTKKKRKKEKKDGDDGGAEHDGSPSFQTRYAISISYVDSHAEVRGDVPGVGKNVVVDRQRSRHKTGRHRNRSLAYKGDAEDRASYAEWIGDVLPRTQFEHELIPDVWPPSSESL